MSKSLKKKSINFSEPLSKSSSINNNATNNKQRSTSTSSTMTIESFCISLGVGPLWWS